MGSEAAPPLTMKSRRAGTPPAREGQTKATPPRLGFRLVRPYSTLAGAQAALDNGGRFFNLFARSGDARVSSSELSKAAGVLFDEAKCFLFFDMALARLSADEKSQVVAMLERKQAKRYREHGPRPVASAEAARQPAESTLITEGGVLASSGNGHRTLPGRRRAQRHGIPRRLRTMHPQAVARSRRAEAHARTRPACSSSPTVMSDHARAH